MTADFRFGISSRDKLNTCHPDLVAIAENALRWSLYDFSIIEGRRSLDRQMKMFRQGVSLIDGTVVKGKHNHDPSQAWDFVPYPVVIEGVSAWEASGHWRFYVIIGIIHAAAADLQFRIRSGADWNGNGSNTDQKLHDLPHIELVRGE
jgi:peptidoglycan L-alanyl-D-glutamate endopeptidase CwlK